jgi:hypothetical protein
MIKHILTNTKICSEVVSKPRITPEGKTQADSKAQHPRQYVSISRGLQRRHRGSDGVMKPLLALLAVLWGLTLSAPLDAADFLFTWKASTDESITAYRVYQRTGDSPYEMIDEVQVGDLDNPTHPSYWVIGLGDGNSYWFAATSISASNTESDFSNETCITVNGQVVQCNNNDENGTTVFISCFISTASEIPYQRTTRR